MKKSKEIVLNILLKFICVLTIPIYTAVIQSAVIPEALGFLKPQIRGEVPLFFQFILLDIIYSVLFKADNSGRYARLLSAIVALMLGKLAVNTGWVVPEAVLLLVFVCLLSKSGDKEITALRMVIVLTTPVLGLWSIPLGVLACTVLTVYAFILNKK